MLLFESTLCTSLYSTSLLHLFESQIPELISLIVWIWRNASWSCWEKYHLFGISCFGFLGQSNAAMLDLDCFPLNWWKCIFWMFSMKGTSALTNKKQQQCDKTVRLGWVLSKCMFHISSTTTCMSRGLCGFFTEINLMCFHGKAFPKPFIYRGETTLPCPQCYMLPFLSWHWLCKVNLDKVYLYQYNIRFFNVLVKSSIPFGKKKILSPSLSIT